MARRSRRLQLRHQTISQNLPNEATNFHEIQENLARKINEESYKDNPNHQNIKRWLTQLHSSQIRESVVRSSRESVVNKGLTKFVTEASIDVDLKGVSREGVTYNAKVGVINPSSQSVPICEISYVLKSDGRVILSGSIPDPGSIAGKKTTMLDVPMMVPHSIVVSLVRDIFRDWDFDYELELGLIIDIPIIGNFTFPLSSKGEIKVPSFKDIFGGEDDEEEKKE